MVALQGVIGFKGETCRSAGEAAGAGQVFRPAEGRYLPAGVLELRAAVNADKVSYDHPALHLKAGHQGVGGTLFHAKKSPDFLDRYASVLVDIVHHIVQIAA